MARKTVDLNALIENDGGEICLEDGTTHRVRPISGAAYKRYREDGDEIVKGYDVAAMCVPSLARDQVDQLTPRQVAKILELALGDVSAVEDEHTEATADPNGPAPATTNRSPA